MHVLALDGGGAAGYVTAQFLSHLEQDLNEPCYRLFDIICGVSTGSIIGACLASGMPAADVVASYKRIITNVFPPTPMGFGAVVQTIKNLFKPQYSLTPVQTELHTIFDPTIDNVSLKTRFMCHSVKITYPAVSVFWKSWYKTNRVGLIDAILNSCSAPTYFSPRKVKGEWYVDGGVAANCVAMIELAEAAKLGATLESLYLVNVQTGGATGFTSKQAGKLGGQLSWTQGIADLMTYCGAELAEYQAHQLIGFRNHVIKPSMYAGIASTNFAQMDELAIAMYAEHGPALKAALIDT